MDKMWLWFWYSVKRQLKRPVFLISLILLPVLLTGAGYLKQQDSEGIRIALYQTEEDRLTEQVFQKLVEGQGEFSFYVCDSLEQLKSQVASKKAECGYVFTKGFSQAMKDGQWKRMAEVYKAPSTVADILSTEVVFAAMMEVYAEVSLMDFVAEEPLLADFDEREIAAQAEQLWNQYLKNGSTFSFVYETIDGKHLTEQTGAAGFPVRGILAVYLFMVGLFGGVTLSSDEKKGLFIPIPYGKKLGCKLVSLGAPVCLAAASVLVSLFVTGQAGNLWYEAGALAVYGAEIVLFSFGIKTVVRNPVVLASLIPVFLMGSLLLCPVIIDLGTFVPQLEPLGRLFLPYYYLKMF